MKVNLAAEGQRFIKFGIAGGAGFIVEGAVLTLLVTVLGFSPYWMRAVSFSAAVTTTYLINRRLAFADRAGGRTVMDFFVYVASQLGGLVVNLVVYGLIVHQLPLAARWPVIALVFGVAAGLVVNYTLARFVVFRRSKPHN